MKFSTELKRPSTTVMVTSLGARSKHEARSMRRIILIKSRSEHT